MYLGEEMEEKQQLEEQHRAVMDKFNPSTPDSFVTPCI